jgi:four helix bundle protein
MIESYKDLLVWQKAIALVFEVYRVTRSFPPDERFGLTSQVRRASVSIATNIAEGHGRYYTKDFVRFLGNAGGSANEVETELIIARGLRFATRDRLTISFSLVDEVRRMLNTLRRRLVERAERGT